MSAETKHTPGPWKHNETWGLIKHGTTEICALHSGNTANARLITSAPDLLAALEDIVIAKDTPTYGGHTEHRQEAVFDAIEVARAAIAKAKGE